MPAGFSTVTADGITVAWDPAVALEATPLAFTTAGLLAQLGLVTGTTPRGELTVIVYASLDDLHTKGGAPEWSAGLYDGAVRVPAVAHQDFGIDIRALRHELVHAQLHAAIGCTSIWLDEGLAQWFENMPPEAEWLRMLRDHHMLDPRAMQVSTLEDVHADRPEQVYATSLAMVLYAFERGDSVADLVRHRRSLEVSDQDLLASLARRLFGMPPGSELDAILAGRVCCKGMARLDELACGACKLGR